MADRHDPIADDTPNKRRKLNISESNKAWNSEDDDDTQWAEEDFQPTKISCSAAQFHADIGSISRSSQTPAPYVTQPTQTLEHVTQPTQPLRPNVQVERSSPPAPWPDTQSQRPMPAPISRAPFSKPNGVLARSMAPQGTTFRRPVGVQPKPPVVDVDSDDDPPVEHSDDETQGLSSNIKPTNFKRAGRGLDSSPNRAVVKESPVAAKETDFQRLISGFKHQARPADDSASAYGNSYRPRAPRPPPQQPQASRQTAFDSLVEVYQSLDDVPDYNMRKKVQEIQNVLGADKYPVQRCMEALHLRKADVSDAMVWLVDMEEAETAQDELSTLSPIQRKGVATSTSQSSQREAPSRPLAKQQVKVPTKSIADKYRRDPHKPQPPVQIIDDDEDEVRPRKGRLIQRKRPTVVDSPPSSPPLAPQRSRQRAVIALDSDEEGGTSMAPVKTRETVPEPTRRTKPEELRVSVQELRDQRLLGLLNSHTARDLAELSGQPEDTIQFVLEKRPFKSLDDASSVVMETLTKTGKKSKKTRAVGEKLVEDCREVMTGYEAIDELVVECEAIAKPIQEALRGWGIGDADGELQLMNLDEAHDSGIGTPSSTCADEPTKPNKSKFIGQPENMSSELVMKNYQLVGLNWLYLLFQKETSCILADDMGLGKTCQIIAFLSYLQLKNTDGVALIIVPGSTLENWLREFERFAPGLHVRPYYGALAEREELRWSIEEERNTIDVIVTTYDMAVPKEDNKFLRKLGPFSVCVYDEAHALRNPNSQRYSQLVRIGADHKILLTGTPLQNNLQELVAILAFIMPDLFQAKREELEYIFKHKASTKDTASAALLSNERIARARTMMTPFILRRKKAQVLDLPAKTSRIEYCDMTDTQANYYADLVDEAQKFYNEKAAGTKASAKASSNVIMALRKAAIHPLLARRIYDDRKLDRMVSVLRKSDEFGSNPPDKILSYINGEAAISLKGGDFGLHRFCYERDLLRKKFALKNKEWMDAGKVKKFEELVKGFAANGDRVLVFSQFTTLMDILEAVLEQMHVKFMRLDGSTKMDTRQDMIDQFYEDTSITVFMLSTRAGGAGINLAAANKVIIFDSGFNPQDDIQAENRAHRVGQSREVEVVRLVTRGTIEEQIHALGESKLALDDRVAGEGASDAEARQVEKAGEQMVEQMFVKKLQGEDEGYAAAEEDRAEMAAKGGDLKDAFKTGLESAGVSVASKQAQY